MLKSQLVSELSLCVRRGEQKSKLVMMNSHDMKLLLSLGTDQFLRVKITCYFRISVWLSKFSLGKKVIKSKGWPKSIQITMAKTFGLFFRWCQHYLL